MKLIKLLTWILFVFISTKAFSQDAPKVIPPSPSSSELEKYIDHKVSLSNGVPEITIPIYEIKLGDLSIPITLSYHASGIKYGQTNGDLGVGWTLNPGYRISRVVYGLVDERTSKPTNAEITNALSGPNLNVDHYLSKFNHSKDAYRFMDDLGSTLDGQYDIFSYTLDNTSGKFLISDRNNKTTDILTGEMGAKINYTTKIVSSTPIINSFNFTDIRGNHYEFGRDASGDEIFESIGFTGGKVSTAWPLTKVTNSFNQQIQFKYNKAYEQNKKGVSSMDISMGASVLKLENILCIPYTHNESTNTPPGTYEVENLDEIITPYEKIKFYRTSNSQVDSLIVSNLNGERIKTVKFSYSYGQHRFVDAVKIFDSNTTNNYQYNFEYYNKNNYAKNYDFFGYYADSDTGASFLPYGKTEDFFLLNADCTQSQIAFEYGQQKSYIDQSIYSLKKIQYPTGGYTIYTYEQNKYDSMSDGIQGSGLRVGNISSYDSNNNLLLSKKYIYGRNGSGIGIGQSLPDLSKKVQIKERAVFAFDEKYLTIKPIRTLSYSSVPNEEVSDNFVMSNYGWYDEVKEITSGILPSGYTIHRYENGYLDGGSYLPNSPQYPSPMIRTYDYRMGPLLTEKEIYKYTGSTTTLQQKETYTYNKPVKLFNGFKVIGFATLAPGEQNQSPNIFNFYSSGLSSLFNYNFYNILGGSNDLQEITTITYESNGLLKNTKKFSYNSIGQQKKIEENNSSGETITTYLKYPIDYNYSSSGNNNFTTGIQNLISKNILSPVIEKYIQKSDNSGSNLRTLSASFSKYNDVIPRPEKLYTLDAVTGVDDFLSSDLTLKNGILDSRYRSIFNFNSYDNFGNIQEQEKVNGIKEVFLWGYDNKYPVAKITGKKSYNDIISQSGINPLQLQNITNEAELTSFLKPLYSIPDVLVNIYTYKPLVGMTSETDPTGNTSYYEYDGFGRLSTIKDLNKKLIKTFCYNYIGQNINCDSSQNGKEFRNRERSKSFIKNDCPEASTPGIYIYTVPANKYSSMISQEDADQKAQNDINVNGQTTANNNAICTSITTFYNSEKSQPFTRNNCPAGAVPSTYNYIVPANKYSSTISKEDADQKAQDDINTNGQYYANINGACTSIITFYNSEKSQPFTRNNCPAGAVPGTYNYIVPANKYSSTISKEDADQKAQDDINTNGQYYANINGSCLTSVQISVNISTALSKPVTIEFVPVNGGNTISKIFTSSTNFIITPGTYNIFFSIPSSGNPLHQVNIPGTSPIWIQPLSSNPAISGGNVNNYYISDNMTISFN